MQDSVHSAQEHSRPVPASIIPVVRNLHDETKGNSAASEAALTPTKDNDSPPSAESSQEDTGLPKTNRKRPLESLDASHVSIASTSTPGLSKNQRRRLMRREKMFQRKQERKEERRAKALADGRDLEAERQRQAERAAQGEGKKRQHELWQTVKLPLAQQSFQIAIDCSFESQMMEREIASLAQQLRYCYAYNKRANNPCLVGVTSLQEGSETLLRLQKEMGFDEWKHRLFTCTHQSLEEYYSQPDQKSNIVYLTSDSETVLNQLQDDKIYVIGGIVDRNRLKKVAMNRAQALGVATAKLPLDKHLAQMASTPVLACNHVFNILLKTREYGNDWSKALQEILPTRKEPRFKKQTAEDKDDEEEHDITHEKDSDEEAKDKAP